MKSPRSLRNQTKSDQIKTLFQKTSNETIVAGNGKETKNEEELDDNQYDNFHWEQYKHITIRT